MTGVHTFTRSRRLISNLLEKLSGDNMSRRRRLTAPVLCESLEPRTLMSAVTTHFGDMSQATLSSNVLSTVTADFNGDGVMDIASTLQEGNLRVSLGTKTNGVVTYDAAKTTDYAIGVSDATNLVALDINGDGALDFAFTSSNGINVILGNKDSNATTGNGTFQNMVSSVPTVGLTSVSLFKANLNNDSSDDLVLIYKNGSNAYARSYYGGSTPDLTIYTNASMGNASTVSSVVAGDLNNDGLTDFASVIDGHQIQFMVSENSGGAYSLHVLPMEPGLYLNTAIADLKIANVYGNSYPQIVALTTDGNVYVSQTSATAADYSTVSLAATLDSSSRFLLIDDVNSDGYQDVFGVSADGTLNGRVTKGYTFTNVHSETVSGNLFGATGTGTISSVWLADANGDGVLDFVSRGQTGPFVGVTLNNTYATTSHTINSTNRSYSYVDDNGDTVTIKLSGPGTAVINLNDAAKEVDSITLSGTTIKSSLKITVANKKDITSPKTTTIGRIVLNNCTLGTLDAASVNFETSINIQGVGGIIESDGTGFIKNIKIRDLGDDTKITLSGSDAKNPVTLQARLVGSNCDLDFTNQSLSSATFVEFGNYSGLGAVTLGKLSVTGDKNLGIAGNFAGFLNLSGIANSTGYTLKTAVIAGALAFEGDSAIPLKANLYSVRNGLYVVGNAGSITVGSLGELSRINVDNSLSTLTIKGDCLGGVHTGRMGTMTVSGKIETNDRGKAEGVANVSDGPSSVIDIETTLSKLTVKGNFQGTLYAGSISTMTVYGNTLDSSFTIRGVTGKISTINSLTLRGTVENVEFYVTGNIKTFNAKSLDAQCYMDVSGNIASLTTSSDLNGTLTAASIGSMNVKGKITSLDLTLNATGATKPILNSLSVKGAVDDLDVISSGSVGTISGSSFGSASSLAITGDVSTLKTTKGDFSAVVTATGKLNSWTVKGNLTGATATLGSNTFAANTYMLGTLSVTGAIQTSTILGYGSIGTISAKTLNDSRILAGSTDTGAIANASNFVIASQKIVKLTVSGDKAAASSTNKSVIGAMSIGTISLAYPDSTNTPSVAANAITRMSVTRLDGKKSVTTTDKNLVGAAADPHTDDNVTLNLFSLERD